MVTYYTPDGAHILKAKKMATWRNADAKLAAANVTAIDDLIDLSIDLPVAITSMGGQASYLPHYYEAGYVPGLYTELLYLQSGINLYPALGVCATTDDTPEAGYYSKAFSIRTTQTPVNQGRHVEREHATASERWDLLGMCLRGLHYEMSEASQVGTQLAQWGYAYAKTTSTDDITPAVLTRATHPPYKWEDLTVSTFTYNSETIQATIIGWSFDVENNVMFLNIDSSGLFAEGIYLPHTVVTTTFEILPYDTNIRELIATAPDSYLTDVDVVVKLAKNATTHYLEFTHDKCYAYPFTWRVRKQSGFVERYFIRLAQRDTGSITATEISELDDDYYET